MKYCTKCGAQLEDDVTACNYCGAQTDDGLVTGKIDTEPKTETAGTTSAQNVAKVFMIIGTVVNALCYVLIPLIWCIPMTIHYCNALKKGKPVGLGFKICTLLFVNVVAGILMLCDGE